MPHARTPTLRARATIGRRDPERSKACAAVLEQLGFRVTAISERGCTLVGPQAVFESVFDTDIVDPEHRPRFASTPRFPPELARHIASIYFPTPPTHFTDHQENRHDLHSPHPPRPEDP